MDRSLFYAVFSAGGGLFAGPASALAGSDPVPGSATPYSSPFFDWRVGAAIGLAFLVGLIVSRVLSRPGAESRGAAHGPVSGPFGSRDPLSQDTRMRVATERITDLTAKNQELMKFFVNFPEQVKKLNSSLEVQDVTAIVVRMTTDMLKAQEVSFFLLNKTKGVLQLVEFAGLPRELKGALIVATGQGPICWALDQATVRGADEYLNAVQGVTEAVTEIRSARLRTALVAPIILRDQVLGALNIGRLDNIGLHEKRLLAMIADTSAIALANAFHIGRAKEEANLDGMTKLYNHKYFKTRLAQELGRAATFSTPLSLFLFDVDNFKHYNDTNGHPAGDEVLKKIASLVRSHVRRSDLVARYGGEEFVVMLIGSEKSRALVLAEQIRALIEKTDFPFGERQPLGRVTISGGVAGFPDDSGDPAEVVKCADEALYEAKHAGRNLVIAHERPEGKAPEGPPEPSPPRGRGPATPAPPPSPRPA